jgi:hypothetical protein
MKKIQFAVIAVFLISSFSFSQFQKNNFEIGFNLGVGSSNYETTVSGHTNSNSTSFLTLSAAPAYYFFNGVALELELGVTSIERSDPAFFILPNIGYTRLVGDNVGLFAHIGYGASNGVTIPGSSYMYKQTSGLDVSVFNFGAGAKYLVGKNAYIKTEVNYRRFAYDIKESYFYADSKQVNSFITLNLGIGLTF